jgi:hypothetical protein
MRVVYDNLCKNTSYRIWHQHTVGMEPKKPQSKTGNRGMTSTLAPRYSGIPLVLTGANPAVAWDSVTSDRFAVGVSTKNLLTPWLLKDGPGGQLPACLPIISRDSLPRACRNSSQMGRFCVDVRPTSLLERTLYSAHMFGWRKLSFRRPNCLCWWKCALYIGKAFFQYIPSNDSILLKTKIYWGCETTEAGDVAQW